MEDKTPKLKCVRVLISGKVQGVGYRISTLHQARKLAINGWVLNRFDGGVEAVFEGEAKAVEQMVKWCNLGPSAAFVRDVAIETIEPEGIEGFEIRY